jgi:hypothetical protein
VLPHFLKLPVPVVESLVALPRYLHRVLPAVLPTSHPLDEVGFGLFLDLMDIIRRSVYLLILAKQEYKSRIVG